MKKRLLSTLLALCMVLALLPGTAWAERPSGSSGDGVTWLYDMESTLIIQGTGPMKDYGLDMLPPWYDHRYQIHTVIIGNGVTSIGDRAFYYLENLESITIPNSVTSIGEDVFIGCDSLTSISIPDSVTNIGQWAFSWCSSLTSINVASRNPAYISVDGILFNVGQTLLHTYPAGKNGISYNIPSSVTRIGGGAFAGCRGLTSINVPNSVTSIGSYAFAHCDNLTGIVIPNGVTRIEEHTLEYCGSLASVNIPNSVTSIGDYAFNECSSLTNIVIPDSVTSIGEQAFVWCSNLTSITLPAGTTNIGAGAFWGCSSLSGNVTIPNGVTRIERGVFYGCKSLTSVTIPDSVTNIEWQAFASCNSLKDVYYGGSKAQWKQITIGELNDPLLKATIHYGGAATPDPGPTPGEYEAAVITAVGQTSYFSTLEDAVEYSYTVRRGGTAATVQMLADYAADYHTNGKIGLTFGADISSSAVTLDLNGHSLEGNISNTDHLIIMDSAGGGLVNGAVQNDNYLKITGGTFRGKFASTPNLNTKPHTIISGGTILFYIMGVSSGSIEISGGETTLEVGLELYDSNMVLSGGMFKGDVTLKGSSTITISGGTLFGSLYCDSVIDSGNLTITGGTLCNVTENGQLWSLTDKILTISGTGAIPDYDSHLDVPWDYLTARSSWFVESIVVEDGITRIGDRTFAFYGGNRLDLPNTVTSLGEYSIGFTAYSDDHITYLEIPASVTRIEAGAFDYTNDLKIKFLGSAPVFEDTNKDSGGTSLVFDRSSNITIYYPAGDASWERYVGEKLGADSIEWIPYGGATQTATYTVHISANPTSGGQVRLADVSGTSATYKEGDSATVIAEASSGYRFAYWTENGQRVSTSATYTFNVTKDRTLTAVFEQISSSGSDSGGSSSSGNSGDSSNSDPTYSITVPSRVTGGTVKFSPSNASEGQRVTITVKANAGYALDILTVTDSKGNALTLTDKGDGKYTFTMPKGNVSVDAQFQRIVSPVTPVQPVTANSTNDKLEVDGRPQTPAAYKINDYNYFKLRDIATLLNGTGKQFSVDYDSSTGDVTLTSGQPYTVMDGDLAGVPTKAQQVTATTNVIYINGVRTQLTVYLIDGYNYFKLRDLASALDFYVDWTAERGMFLESDKPYSA